jgi:hypothetical protein
VSRGDDDTAVVPRRATPASQPVGKDMGVEGGGGPQVTQVQWRHDGDHGGAPGDDQKGLPVDAGVDLVTGSGGQWTWTGDVEDRVATLAG